MKFKQLLESGRLYDTDKYTIHDYIDGYYEYEFASKQTVPITILEIGVGKGYSIRLWNDYFSHATIVGMDIYDWAVEMYRYTPNVKIMQVDAYSTVVIDKFPDETFDYIIDDGPHTLDSQIISIQKWLPKVKRNGKLIIEDVQSMDFIQDFQNTLNMKSVLSYRTIDLRKNKNRYDDIIFEIIKK